MLAMRQRVLTWASNLTLVNTKAMNCKDTELLEFVQSPDFLEMAQKVCYQYLEGLVITLEEVYSWLRLATWAKNTQAIKDPELDVIITRLQQVTRALVTR